MGRRIGWRTSHRRPRRPGRGRRPSTRHQKGYPSGSPQCPAGRGAPMIRSSVTSRPAMMIRRKRSGESIIAQWGCDENPDLFGGFIKLRTSLSGPAPRAAARKPGWRARLPVGSVFAVFAFSYGVYYGFSVFYVALLEEFGWSRASTAGVFSVFVTVIGLGGLVGGALLDRFGPSLSLIHI